MNHRRLSSQEILTAYDALAPLYGLVPPLILWRSWELAAYRRYALQQPVLDLGCGDGRFFRAVFPETRNVIGVDIDPAVAPSGVRTGIYRGVALARSDVLPFREGSFASVFANCSVEHMDDLDGVLRSVRNVLQPGGAFLLSVVTDHFVSWAPVKKLLAVGGAADVGRAVQKGHELYHHLVNALPSAHWKDRLRRAQFLVTEEVPIMTGAAGQAFLILDQLWHVQRGSSEFGARMYEWMQSIPQSVTGLRQVFDGLLTLSATADEHAGMVFLAKRE